MSRLKNCFQALKANNKKAVIPYVMAGDPAPNVTVNLLHQLVQAGADVIELGLPFSDPMADGPVIALAAERALAAGTNTLDVIHMVAEFRKTDQITPIVLMGYLNPLEIIGYQNFATQAKVAGVDGVLMVDLPPEETYFVEDIFKKSDLDVIFLMAPTTTSARMDKIIASARGYIYYVSLKGVTGSSTVNTQEVQKRINLIKSKTDLPVGVGFGISNAQTAAALAQTADAVIVGSALVRSFAELPTDQAIVAITSKVKEIRQAVDAISL